MTAGAPMGRVGRGMAVATLASRVAGFVRILTLTAALGLGSRLLDSYNVANTLPNTVYELVAGGAMASIVVPLLARAALTEPEDGVVYAQRLLSFICYGLGVVTLAAIALAPVLVELFTPGFDADQRHLAVVLTRFFLPQILFYGVSAAAGAVLNMRGRFAVPTWAPLANSVVVIAVALAYLAIGGTTSVRELAGSQLLLLGVGTSAGVCAQMVMVLWALARSGFPLRPRLDPRGIGVRRIARLGGWALVSVGAAQVLFTVATRAASGGGPGGVSAYQNAYALFQMPFAVVTSSVMTAMLPRLSHSAARNDSRRLSLDLSAAVRLATVALAPVAAAMVVLGPQVATLLFAHGRSSASTVALLGAIVAAFGVAVVPFTGYMILLRGFFAVQDARTPALITTGVSIVGVGGCLAAAHLLPPRLVVVGIPIAYALAYTVGLLAAAVALRHRLGRIDGRRLARTYGRVALATIAAASVAAGVAGLQTRLTGTGWTGALLSLITAGLLGAATYLLAGRLLHLTEVRQVLATVGIRAPARGPE